MYQYKSKYILLESIRYLPLINQLIVLNIINMFFFYLAYFIFISLQNGFTREKMLLNNIYPLVCNV